MTTFRQIEANRRNAQRSTGPKAESGKQRPSQNAVRDGLTAETVIKLLEDPEDYHAFKMCVTTDYDPNSASSVNWCCSWRAYYGGCDGQH
jgi:hypothetical protein